MYSSENKNAGRKPNWKIGSIAKIIATDISKELLEYDNCFKDNTPPSALLFVNF